jgi:hypothetical protein
VTPVTHQYEVDVQEKHISLCYDRHKSGSGVQITSCYIAERDVAVGVIGRADMLT